VAFSKVKEVELKILRKVGFLLWGGQSVPLGQTVYEFLRFIKYLRFFKKLFEKNPFGADIPQVLGERSEFILDSNR
jgi:hypothetical protein